jgi:hypothetical protein
MIDVLDDVADAPAVGIVREGAHDLPQIRALEAWDGDLAARDFPVDMTEVGASARMAAFVPERRCDSTYRQCCRRTESSDNEAKSHLLASSPPGEPPRVGGGIDV